MAELKTKKNDASVDAFIRAVTDENRRNDCLTVMQMMKKITGEEAKMWGTAIVGFGDFHYVYESGREGDWFVTGFSPRKQNLTLYIMPGFERFPNLMKQLGKYKTGKSCLYISKLSDINIDVLGKLIEAGVQWLKDRNSRP